MADAGLVKRIGPPSGLAFELQWEADEPRGSADEASRGRLIARIAGAPVWIDRSHDPARGVRWSMVELLEHLAWTWRYLRYEESDPLGLADRPDRVRAAAERRWDDIPSSRCNEEQRLLRAFEDSHDLARAFQGMWLPPLWVLRQGNLAWVVSGAVAELVSIGGVLETLDDLAGLIAARLAALPDARAVAAVTGWAQRDAFDAATALAIATGCSADTLAEVAKGADLVDFFEWSAARGSALVAAARATGPVLAPTELRGLLVRIRQLPATATPALDRRAREAEAVVTAAGETVACDQGHALARWVREQVLAVPDEKAVDPAGVLKQLGLTIRSLSLGTKSLDAVSVWGGQHGPAVLVNRTGRHAKGAGLRATLAHELCHVLIDRHGALPLGEVLGGRVQPRVEARARAFAAELLIPKSVAGPAFADAVDPARMMGQLTRRYGASREIVAWQARNSEVALTDDVRAFLRKFVSMPGRF
jgi:Zn-dependent peptidase ImmA (M78 family)